jgi:hypothetical protein
LEDIRFSNGLQNPDGHHQTSDDHQQPDISHDQVDEVARLLQALPSEGHPNTSKSEAIINEAIASQKHESNRTDPKLDNFEDAISDIILAACLIIIPMIVLSAVFIGLVFHSMVTVASWTSTVMSFLSAWIMLLVSYPLAAALLKENPGRMPSPLQFWLLIELCAASYGSLWSWLTSRVRLSESEQKG